MKAYLKELLDFLKPFGDVLQVGFDTAAEHIQNYKPKSHVIVSNSPKAKTWAQENGATVCSDDLATVLSEKGPFDTVYFGEDALHAESVAAGESVVAKALSEIPGLLSVKYSNEDIDMLVDQVGYLDARFLHALKQQGQITQEQYNYLGEKYCVEKLTVVANDPVISFAKTAIPHLKQGGRFSSYTLTPSSKYDSANFFNAIIADPSLRYEEKMIPISPTDSYTFDKAVALVIEKANA